MVKKKKRSFMSKLFSRRILLLIQFIVSIIFLGCIYILKMLPMKYYLILCGIIFLLWMLSSLLIKSGIKKKKRENKYARLIFGKLLSLILSIALGFVSVMAFKGNNLSLIHIYLTGKEVVVVGRSNIVGKPVALLCLQKNATVTIAHSKTKNLKEVCQRADVLIAAVGRAKMINSDYVKEGAVVLDVGINRDENRCV